MIPFYSMRRDWKKNDGKYSSKDEPKGYRGYSSKDEPKGHKYGSKYSSKDEPKHEPNKHKVEPKDSKKSSTDHGKYGIAYSMMEEEEEENASCPSADDFDMNAPCDYEGECGFGEESCCGETFVSLKCQCAGSRSFCFHTDACYGASRFGCNDGLKEAVLIDA